MPTPSDPVEVLPSPPLEASSSSRASFASCPPEEEREYHAPRASRVDSPAPAGVGAEMAVEEGEDEHMTNQEQEPTPEPETVLRTEAPGQAQEKGEHVEDAAGVAEQMAEDPRSAPSASASPEAQAPSESSDARLAESMSTAAISTENEPLYLTFPRDRSRLQPTITSSFLRPGSKFKGTQQSDRQVYDVQVEIKDVDMAESFLCGYLRIQGLTDDHPTLTTFFEGEIIGPKHLFKTAHPSWGSSEKVDLQHWARFPAFQNLARTLSTPQKLTTAPSATIISNPSTSTNTSANTANGNSTSTSTNASSGTTGRIPSTLKLKDYDQREHLFMRWKEYFLVPDHRVKTITGASFEGFYYICFNQCEGVVSGIYFHAKSEKYQQLELRHVPDGGCWGAMEFR